MTKKRIILISTLAAVFVAVVVFIIARGFKQSSEGITRYEWIQMLTEAFEMTEAGENAPYFSDVSSDSPYFTAVQASCEWDVIDKADRFDGDEKVNVKYAVLTAMRAVGAYRVKLYLGLKDLPTEDDYLKLALDKQLIENSKLSSNVEKEEAEMILEKAKELYQSELWLDDYVDVKYAESAKELDAGDVTEYNAEKDEIKVSAGALSGLSVGDVIVFDNRDVGTKVSKKVADIKQDGVVLLTDAALEETLEYLAMSDIIPISSDEIIEGAKRLHGREMTSSYGTFKQKKGAAVPVLNASTSYEGVAIDVKFSSDGASVTLTSHAENEDVAFEIPGNFLRKSSLDMDDDTGTGNPALAFDGFAEMSVDLKNITLGVQTDYSILSDLNYLVIQADCDFEPKFQVGGGVEAVIPIASVPLAGYGHLCGVMLDISLVVNLDGYAEFALEFTPQASFEYRKNAGTRNNMSVNLQKEDGNICASLEAQAQFAPTVYILGDNIADIELEAGAGASGEFTTRRKSNITMCADIDFYAPIASFGWLNGDGAYLAKWLPSGTISIYTSDNAPYRKKLHFERDKKGQWTLVPECTYKEGEYVPNGDAIYYGEFPSDFKKVNDHYEAVGKLYVAAYFPVDEVEQANVGDQLTCEDVDFTVTETGEGEYTKDQDWDNGSKQSYKWCILDGKYYTDTRDVLADVDDDGTVNVSVYSSYVMSMDINGNSLPVFDYEAGYLYILVDDNFTFKTADFAPKDSLPKGGTGEWCGVSFWYDTDLESNWRTPNGRVEIYKDTGEWGFGRKVIITK